MGGEDLLGERGDPTLEVGELRRQADRCAARYALKCRHLDRGTRGHAACVRGYVRLSERRHAKKGNAEARQIV